MSTNWKLKINRSLSILMSVSLIVSNLFTPLSVFAEEATSSAQIQETTTLLPQPLLVPESLDNLTVDSAATHSNPSAIIRQPASLRTLSKDDFRSNEKVAVVVDNVTSSEITSVLSDDTGKKVEVEMEELESGSFTIISITPPISFKPGNYELKISGPNNQSWQQNFTWGVLAINTNKSIYLPQEMANLSMAVLDEEGKMVCDAKVNLNISNQILNINEELSTDNSKIKVNPECSIKGFTLNPDYEADYLAGGVGKYDLILTAQTKNGTHTITDSFEVREEVAFDVERVTATRIYPPSNYPVTFNILANEDFEGEIQETVPESFAISPATDPVRSFDELKAVTAKIKSDDLLQAAIASIGLPFDPLITLSPISSDSARIDGENSVSLGFGQNLVDPVLINVYEKYGLAGHDGIDFALPSGTPVMAVDDGEVVRVQANGDYGDMIVIKHQWGKSYYGHLSQFDVQEGQKILKGEKIALSGNTGLSTGPHLHFSIKPQNSDFNNGYYGKINPATFLGLEDGTLTAPVKVLSWKVKVQKGEKLTLGYQFRAPNISPEFYKLGSLKFIDNKSKLIFEEARLWQIAADVTTFITSGTTWTVPSDWNDSNNTIEVIGGGGAGGDTEGVTGGGGGGGYSKISNLDLTPGASVTIKVGTGGSTESAAGTDTFFNRTAGSAGTCADTVSVCAKGGSGNSGANGGAGGAAASGVGTTKYSGGTGGKWHATSPNCNGEGSGGGGGGAAGPSGAGGAGGNCLGVVGGGGGGNGGGEAGNIDGQGAGGDNIGGTGGGAAGTPGVDGTNGGGGGAGSTAGTTGNGGTGGVGTEWDATHGSGGGGGGNANDGNGVNNNNDGGLYGGGGGGGSNVAATFGIGAAGIIVVIYTAGAASATNDQLMRHGAWFSSQVEQPFTF